MKDYAPLRIAGDQCFLFAMACIFASEASQPLLYGAMVAACLILGILAVWTDSIPLRILCTLPPAGLLLLANGLIPMIFLGVAWLYYALLLATAHGGIEYTAYRTALIFMTVVVIFCIMMTKAIGLFRNRDFTAESIFLITMLMLGFLTLQTIRMCVRTSVRWKLQNLMTIAVPTFGFAGISVLLYVFFTHARKVAEILAMPFILLVQLFSGLMGRFFNSSMTGREVTYVHESFAPTEPHSFVLDTFPESKGFDHGWNLDLNWAAILTVALSIIVAIILTALVIRYLRNSRVKDPEAHLADTQEEKIRRSRRKRKKAADASDDIRIRQIYREYLRYLSMHGQKIGKENTSLEILNAENKKLVTESDKKLRALYLIARYGDPNTLTQEDSDQAKRCLEQIQAAYAEAEAAQEAENASAEPTETERRVV